MQIKVLFNKEALNRKLHTGWGLSFLIGDKILFDTGEKGEWLLKNMAHLGVDINKIEVVVVSHDHWDHTGGLWSILEKKKIKVYALPGFSNNFKEKVKRLGGKLLESKEFFQVEKGIFLTGEIGSRYEGYFLVEQALIVETDKGVSLFTGCSHPGILRILELIKDRLKVSSFYFVGGGFHLWEKGKEELRFIVEGFRKFKVLNVSPTHCSGQEAEKIFKETYKDNFISLEVGKVLTV